MNYNKYIEGNPDLFYYCHNVLLRKDIITNSFSVLTD